MSIKEKCYPNARLNSVLDITDSFLSENNIKAIITDVDNTLVDYEGNVLEGITDWISGLQKKGIKICILTNTKKPNKAKKMSKMLNDIPYISFAKKPFKFGFKKAKKILDLNNDKEIAVVGDQIMTDILRSKQKQHVFNTSKTIRKIWDTTNKN